MNKVTTNEREIAIREGHKIHAETSYFKPRPQLDFENARHVFCEGFDRGYIAAAKADSERQTGKMVRNISLAADAREAALENEIAELKSDNETLVSINNKLSNEVVELNEMYEGRIDHLDAHINDLREALERITYRFKHTCDYDIHNLTSAGDKSVVAEAIQILASTPAQSMIKNNNEVIKQCIKVIKSFKQADFYTGEESSLYINLILNECVEALEELKNELHT